MFGQPATDLGQPGVLDIGGDPAADDSVAFEGDDERRSVGPVIPREVGQVLGRGRGSFDVPDFRRDASPGEHRLGLLAELTVLFGEYLEIQRLKTTPLRCEIKSRRGEARQPPAAVAPAPVALVSASA